MTTGESPAWMKLMEGFWDAPRSPFPTQYPPYFPPPDNYEQEVIELRREIEILKSRIKWLENLNMPIGVPVYYCGNHALSGGSLGCH